MKRVGKIIVSSLGCGALATTGVYHLQTTAERAFETPAEAVARVRSEERLRHQRALCGGAADG